MLGWCSFAKNSAAEEVGPARLCCGRTSGSCSDLLTAWQVDKIIVTRELTGMDAAHITSLVGVLA